jgi:hypothetical protein
MHTEETTGETNPENARMIEGDNTLQPDWKNAPTILDLKYDFTNARTDHKAQIDKVNAWLENLHITGGAKVKKRKGKSAIQPKLIRKQAEWRYPALSEPFLSTDDIFNVDPVTHGDKAAAIQNSMILNNQFNTQLDKVRLIDESVRAAVDEGTLIYRVGWEYEDEEVEVEQPVVELTEVTPQSEEEAQQLQQQYMEIHQIMLDTPDDYNQLPDEVRIAHEQSMQDEVFYVGEVTGIEMVTETRIIKNQPTVEVCDYRDITIDPTTKGDPSKLQFVIYSFETSQAELRQSDIDYKNIDAIVYEQASPLAEPDTVATSEHPTFSFADNPRKRLIAHEYWGFYDIHGTGKTVPIVATWVGNTMIRMEENPFPDKQLPFVFIPYLPVRKSIYGEPDGELLVDNQKVIGAVTRGMVDIMGRSANGQIGFRQDALDVTNKRKYEAGQDYEFSPIVNPLDAIINHTYPEIPRSAEFMLNMNSAEAESMSGVRAFNSTTSQGLGDTATEARGALDAASKREIGILRRVAEGIKQVGRKVLAMNAEFLSEEEVIRVTNDQFVTVRRDDLAGKFDVKLSISTAEADNEKAKELAFMLQTMGNNMDVGMSKMILSDIARLRKMPELAKEIDNYQPQPDPLAVKKAELEIALLEAQVMNERNKGAENAQDVNLKAAKTATEEAKARNLNSDSDTKDLDFLDKESGVEFARELEGKEIDKNNQLDLKAADKLLESDKPEQTAST